MRFTLIIVSASRLTAKRVVSFDPTPTVPDLRYCWHTNSVRSGAHQAIADAILGHSVKKKSLQSLCMTIRDDDLDRAIAIMSLDVGETELWVKK